MSRRNWEALNYYGSFKVQIIPFVARIMYSNPFTTAGQGTINISLYLMPLIDSILGKMVRQKTPEWNQSHNTVIVHRYAIEPRLVSSFSKTFLNRPITKEAAEGWEKGQKRSERESGLRVTVALPLHLHSIGDSSVWRAVFVLYCYWWHFGVTVSRWNGSPPTSQPAAAQPVEQWGPDESGLELRRPQLGATP